MSEHLLVVVSWPDNTTASDAAKTLLSQQLAACISIIPQVMSHYWWDGEICGSDESFMLIKTPTRCYSKLEASILEIHPYDVPEIIASDIQRGYHPYLKWINESTQK